jgi:hypothetical protein
VVKRANRPTPRAHPEPSPRGTHDGMLDRLRFRWLRTMFSHSADL